MFRRESEFSNNFKEKFFRNKSDTNAYYKKKRNFLINNGIKFSNHTLQKPFSSNQKRVLFFETH